MTKDVIQSLVRHILTALGALVVSRGVVVQSDAEAIVGGVVASIGLGWSVWDKFKNRN
jgi:hypothetical protein